MQKDNLINVAVVGLGYWGPNYLRVLSQIDGVNIRYLCDKDEKKLYNFHGKGYRLVDDYKSLAEDPSLDAVFIVTPASTHFEIAKFMLESGKHVLVEKPLTKRYRDAVRLWRLSNEVNKVLMTGHVYVYDPAVNYMRDMLGRRELGKLYYGVGLRMGLGPIREDANCLWDLAPHELSILDHLLGKMPSYVSAQASSFIRKNENIYDYANVYMTYDDGFSFSFIVGWYGPEKVRTITLLGSERMIKFDDANKTAPITIYNKSITFKPLAPQADYGLHNVMIREGDTIIPFIPQEEPLKLEVKHFLECVRKDIRPLSDGLQGVRVVSIIEAINESVNRRGLPVKVNFEVDR